LKELTRYKELIKEMKAYEYVMNVINWDSNTEAPRASHERRAEMMAFIGAELFKRSTAAEYVEVVGYLHQRIQKLDMPTRREIIRAKKALDKVTKIPQEEYIAYQTLLNLTQLVWEDALHNNDYSSFKTNLAQIIEFNKKFIQYYDKADHPYNVLLDDFEDGMNMEKYDAFFDVLKKELVPFVKQILETKKEFKNPFETKKFPVDRQELFSQHLLDTLQFDRNKGLLKKSVHPFTWNTSPSDVRLTTRYQDDLAFSSIFATIHELGHATYEQQVDPKWENTLLSGGTSMGIHESQSRLYENTFGRSRAFWSYELPKLRKLFPKQLKELSLDDMVLCANKVQASLIRVEADELTYPLHIMVRYDIERMLFSNEITVEELPQKWNQLMQEYLGVTPPNDSLGVLQDVHWSAGLIGYFPTYALGSAYAAQIYYTMKQELDIEAQLSRGKFKKINLWLKKKIHQYGGSKSPEQILLDVTNEPFNPMYYVQYLKEKYTELYLK
jgi:carboxypeptidase Taq